MVPGTASRGSNFPLLAALGVLGLGQACVICWATPPWEPLSTLCIVVAALAAAGAALRQSHTVPKRSRVFWYALTGAVLLQASTLFAELLVEFFNISIANHASALVVLPSVLSVVPLLLVSSLRWRPIPVLATVKALLGLIAGLLLYQAVFDLVTVHGAASLQNATRLALELDLTFGLLSLAVLLRLIGAVGEAERRFFYVASVFLVADTCFAGLHNHLLLHLDSLWLDLLLTAPHFILIWVANRPMPSVVGRMRAPESLQRLVSGASPVLLCILVVSPGLLVIRQHFVRGALGIFAGAVGYGILNTLIHAQSLKAQRELHDARNALEEMVGLDALTGIPNRRAFDRTLAEEFRRAAQTGLPLTLLMVDADCFKLLNDTYGHPYGDMCLEQIASSIRSSLERSTDFAARYGGEEFAIILPQTPKAAAGAIAERVRKAVELLAIRHARSPFGRVTLSIGGATLDDFEGLTPLLLLEAADKSLYQAKQAGRNRVVIADHIQVSRQQSFDYLNN